MKKRSEENRRYYLKKLGRNCKRIKIKSDDILNLTDEELESVYRSGMNNLRIKLAREGYTCQELIDFILNLEIN